MSAQEKIEEATRKIGLFPHEVGDEAGADRIVATTEIGRVLFAVRVMQREKVAVYAEEPSHDKELASKCAQLLQETFRGVFTREI